jgi:hypothetical protein
VSIAVADAVVVANAGAAATSTTTIVATVVAAVTVTVTIGSVSPLHHCRLRRLQIDGGQVDDVGIDKLDIKGRVAQHEFVVVYGASKRARRDIIRHCHLSNPAACAALSPRAVSVAHVVGVFSVAAVRSFSIALISRRFGVAKAGEIAVK